MKTGDRRRGYANSALALFLGSAALLAILVGLLRWNPSATPEQGQRLVVYCAAGLKTPVQAAALEYEKAYGVEVQLQFGGSQTLLVNVEVSKRGDLYIPADDFYVTLAEQKNLIDEVIPLAETTPVIAVPKGNPKKIETLAQLISGEFKVAQANPDAAAVGRVTREVLMPAQWEKLQKAKVVSTPTVNDVANAVKLGTVDAGIVWDAIMDQYPTLDMVAVSELSKKKSLVSVTVLKCTEQPTAALAFARFLAAKDKGLLEFKKAGMTVVDGDAWAEKPELRLYAGAMLRPAIEETIKDFELREGCQVTTVYNGCGILVAQMKAAERNKPDAYFACEKSFMTQVHDLFLRPVDISSNHLVIAVHKGNPHNIKTLDDLGKPGLRIGVGNEQQCAMGAITQQTLVQGGKRKKVMDNVKVQTPTGDMLMTQLVSGSLDAVIVYISNTANTKDIEVYSIEGIPCANAVQPMAVGKDSQFKHLAGRLMTAIRSRQSRDRFESFGFGWQDRQ